MDSSTGRNPVESASTDEVSAPDLIDGRMPTIDFFPADVVRQRTARWRGVHAKTMQIINHEPLEYRFKQLARRARQSGAVEPISFSAIL